MNLSPPSSHTRSAGFTRNDLVAALAAVCLLSLVALSHLARADIGIQALGCVENLRRLGQAWHMYSQDNSGRLVNNFGLAETRATVSAQTYQTWAHNVVDWTLSPGNTNQFLIRQSLLFPYLDDDVSAFKCDADTFLSPAQQRVGWVGRVRSYSMNGFMGPTSGLTSDPSYRGENSFASGYRQFLLASSIPNPSEMAVFLDEHPDSLNDGFFINNPATAMQWSDFPGSQHEGGAGIAYADGGAEIHRWAFPSTRRPVRYSVSPSSPIPAPEREDYHWLSRHLSVVHGTLGITTLPGEQLRFIWSQNPASFVLQSASNLVSDQWTDVAEIPQRSQGQSVVTLPVPDDSRVYRLFRP